MFKNISRIIRAATLFFFCTSCINAHAELKSGLSFIPFQICKRAPVSPSKTLLNRGYKIYMQVGSWAIFDINGDGWCDWIRGGHEGYRTDNEDPPMREFIYLGSSKGWRHFDQAKIDEKSKANISGFNMQNMLSKHHSALNFYQPIAVYRKGQAQPYIATVVRNDAPAPPPNRDQIDVYQWSDQMDKLLIVSDKERGMIIDFLEGQLCKYPPALMDGEGRFIISMGDLCISNK